MSTKTKKMSNKTDALKLITRNTAEIIGEKDLEVVLEGKEKFVVYWGTAPTGKPHVGYFIPLLKIADFLRAGAHVKILLADLHAALDNTPWNVLDHRFDYYAKAIPEMIQALGVDTKELEFVKGSEYQLKPEYVYDLLQMTSMVSVHDSKKAAAEVVKMGDNPKLSGLLYPLMQAIDEEYLGVHAQLGGTDQRKIMVLAREQLPKLGYKQRIEIMNPLLPGLIGKKMSASDANSKIDLLDEPDVVKKKMNKAYFVEGDTDSGVMAFLEYFLMVVKEDNNESFIIERPEKFGGTKEYMNFEDLKKDVVSKELHPQDIKQAVAKEISTLLAKIDTKALQALEKKAYPEK